MNPVRHSQKIRQTYLNEEVAAAIAQRRLAAQGSFADWFFLIGPMLASIVLLLYFALWSVGVVPASLGERKFIVMLRESELAKRPEVAAVISEADQSLYISRQHFFAAERAFNSVTK